MGPAMQMGRRLAPAVFGGLGVVVLLADTPYEGTSSTDRQRVRVTLQEGVETELELEHALRNWDAVVPSVRYSIEVFTDEFDTLMVDCGGEEEMQELERTATEHFFALCVAGSSPMSIRLIKGDEGDWTGDINLTVYASSDQEVRSARVRLFADVIE